MCFQGRRGVGVNQIHELSLQIFLTGFDLVFDHTVLSLNICWGSPFLLAVIVHIVIVGFPPLVTPRENGCFSLSMV